MVLIYTENLGIYKSIDQVSLGRPIRVHTLNVKPLFLRVYLSCIWLSRRVTGSFAPKTFPPGSFRLYFSPLVVSAPCSSRFAPTPFPPLVVSPPIIEKDKVFIIGFSSVLRKSFYKYTGDMALYNLRQKCM